jgi:protoporphyrinogen/coproporphyrinogen III oxidase
MAGWLNRVPHRSNAALFCSPCQATKSRPWRSGPSQSSIATLARVYYPPVASVVLGFRRADVAHPLDGFGMLIPEKEGFNILGALFSSSLFPNRAPEGEVTITCYIGGARAPELPLKSREELAAIAVRISRPF